MTAVLTEIEREFPEFALAVGRGIYQSVLTDPDTLVVAVAALAALTPSKSLNRLSRVIVAYSALRSADRATAFFAHLGNQVKRLADQVEIYR